MCDKKITSTKLESIISPNSFTAFGTPHRFNTDLNPNFENMFEYQLKQSKKEPATKLQSVSPVTATSIRIERNGKSTFISKSPTSGKTPGTENLFSPSFLYSPLSGGKLPSPSVLVQQIANSNNNTSSSDSFMKENLLSPLSASFKFLNTPKFLKGTNADSEFSLTPNLFSSNNGEINQHQLQQHVNGLVKRMEEGGGKHMNIAESHVVKPPTPKLNLPDFSTFKKKKKNVDLKKKKSSRMKRRKRKDEIPSLPPPLDPESIPQQFSLQKIQNNSNLSMSTSSNAEQSSRGWNMLFRENGIDLESEILTKTRCEEPATEVKSKMYSSLKYEIRHCLNGTICGTEAFLLGRIFVVDSKTGEFVQKNNKSVLKGVVECALTKSSNSQTCTELKGVTKVQFTDVSYHHKKGDFCWEVHYFRPSNLNKPILIKRSAPYKVYARKPSQKKKRNRNEFELSSSMIVQPKNSANNKRKKSNNKFDDFVLRLDDLMKCFNKLKNEEGAIALDLVSTKLNIK